MSEFKPGEIVDITIKGARVHNAYTDDVGFRVLTAIYGEINSTVHVAMETEVVTVERVAPAEWPPEPGDLWRDNGGELWFAVGIGGVVLVPTYPVSSSQHGVTPDKVAQSVGPLTLVHREGTEQRADLVDDPKTWTDGAGTVWDLTAHYVDRDSKTWHWAGGFGSSPGDSDLQPLLSRDDWSMEDVRLDVVLTLHGPLTLVHREGAES